MNDLKRIRMQKNMTQVELAEMLGISRTAVSMWETGNALPRAEILKRLAKILGCTIDELLKNTGKEKASG